MKGHTNTHLCRDRYSPSHQPLNPYTRASVCPHEPLKGFEGQIKLLKHAGFIGLRDGEEPYSTVSYCIQGPLKLNPNKS